MIDDITINAFGDEMEKISGMLGELAKDIGGTAKKWISTGWNKPSGLFEKATHEIHPTQMGQAAKKLPLKDAAGKQVWKERPNASWMGQGPITKHLPVGDKSIVTGLTASAVPAALRKEDEQGLERSRGERVSGLAGGTLGSLAGMGALAHLPMKGLGVTRAIIGGIGGGILGERMATSPYRAARKAQMPQQQMPQEQVNGGVA